MNVIIAQRRDGEHCFPQWPLSRAIKCIGDAVCVCTCFASLLCLHEAVLSLLFSDDSPECSLSAVRKIMSKMESTHEFGLCCVAR